MAASGYRTLLFDLDPHGASGFYLRVKSSKKLTNTAFFKDAEKFTDAIRGSDYENIDILPANISFRDFDVFLSQLSNSQISLTTYIKAVKDAYYFTHPACTPTTSHLTQTVLRTARAMVCTSHPPNHS